MFDVNAINGGGSDLSPLQLSQAEVDKQAFLQLLVTQLKSQDPFEPIKNENFLAQLAQFSSLESLNNIYSEMSNANLLQNSVHNALSTSLIGNYAMTRSETITVSGEEVTEAMFVLPEAGEVRIDISDSGGNVIRTIRRSDLNAGSNIVAWDGKDNDGNRVTDGDYTVGVEYVSGSRAGQALNAFSVGKIHAVRFYGGSPVAVIDNREYYLSDLIEVMDSLPGAPDTPFGFED